MFRHEMANCPPKVDVCFGCNKKAICYKIGAFNAYGNFVTENYYCEKCTMQLIN